MAKGGGKGKGKAKAPELSPEEEAALRREQQIAAKAELRRRMEEEAKNSKINGLKILKWVITLHAYFYVFTWNLNKVESN